MSVLAPGEMHLWAMAPREEDIEYLTPEEKERRLRITNEEARAGFVISLGGLRRVISSYRGCLPQEVVLRRGAHGKPYVENGPEFNLSHTANRTFLLVSSCEVGLDVERAARRVSAEDLARKFFFPEEQARFVTLSKEEKNALFLRHWVCKEAMVKLSGDGIYHGLRDARVVMGRDGAEGEYRGRVVQVRELAPAPGFLAAAVSWERLDVKCFL